MILMKTGIGRLVVTYGPMIHYCNCFLVWRKKAEYLVDTDGCWWFSVNLGHSSASWWASLHEPKGQEAAFYLNRTFAAKWRANLGPRTGDDSLLTCACIRIQERNKQSPSLNVADGNNPNLCAAHHVIGIALVRVRCCHVMRPRISLDRSHRRHYWDLRTQEDSKRSTIATRIFVKYPGYLIARQGFACYMCSPVSLCRYHFCGSARRTQAAFAIWHVVLALGEFSVTQWVPLYSGHSPEPDTPISWPDKQNPGHRARSNFYKNRLTVNLTFSLNFRLKGKVLSANEIFRDAKFACTL